MSAHIHSWIDGHLAVRHRAYETRGAIQLDSGARWPRTTGADVIAIAAMFDDAILINGTPGIALRWRAMLADLERKALRAPRETYLENRVTFWRTLETVAEFLDDMAVLPPALLKVWDIVALSEIGNRSRNAGPTEDGPIAHFDGIKTYDEPWNAQRGSSSPTSAAPTWCLRRPGFGGGPMVVPRFDQLRTYSSSRRTGASSLAKATQVMGYAGVVEKWKKRDRRCRPAPAKAGNGGDDAPKNNEFWRRALEVAIQIAVADEAPRSGTLSRESVKDSVKQLPETIELRAEAKARRAS